MPFSFLLRRRSSDVGRSEGLLYEAEAALVGLELTSPIPGPDPRLELPAEGSESALAASAEADAMETEQLAVPGVDEPVELVGQGGAAPVIENAESPETRVQSGHTGTSEMAARGQVEIVSTEFVTGWASVTITGCPVHVLAILRNEVIGASVARLRRPDLELARKRGVLDAYAFTIVFDRAIAASDVERVQVMRPPLPDALPRAAIVRLEYAQASRIFLLGSPRSGTSEMASTLSTVLKLSWAGEGHGAPLFAAAADALQGVDNARQSLVRFVTEQRLRRVAIEAAKQAYFSVHSSASFLDKTPGTAMVNAAPFLSECFPDAYFVFLHRHPVANLLSRSAKFGGRFEAHCSDWAATMNAWLNVRMDLPHHLEIRQEDMLSRPHEVAEEIARYLNAPAAGPAIGASLSAGTLEHTGAGLGTNAAWTKEQHTAFERICGPIMAAYGYA